MAIEIIALLPDLIDSIKKLVNEKKRREIKSKLPSPDLDISSKKDKIEEVFEVTGKRLSTLWKTTIIMAFISFFICVSMAITAIITGIIMGITTWGIITGGISSLTFFTIILWKPLDKMSETSKAIQIQTLVLMGVRSRWEVCEKHTDLTKREKCFSKKLNRYSREFPFLSC